VSNLGKALEMPEFRPFKNCHGLRKGDPLLVEQRIIEKGKNERACIRFNRKRSEEKSWNAQKKKPAWAGNEKTKGNTILRWKEIKKCRLRKKKRYWSIAGVRSLSQGISRALDNTKRGGRALWQLDTKGGIHQQKDEGTTLKKGNANLRDQKDTK